MHHNINLIITDKKFKKIHECVNSYTPFYYIYKCVLCEKYSNIQDIGCICSYLNINIILTDINCNKICEISLYNYSI